MSNETIVKIEAIIPELSDYIGRIVTIDGKEIKIEKIVGNVGMTLGRAPKDMKPFFYEINGEHLIGMARFHCQMEGERFITEEERAQGIEGVTEKDFQDFEQIEYHIEKLPEKKAHSETVN